MVTHSQETAHRQDFASHGHFGPVTLMSPEEMGTLRKTISKLIDEKRETEKIYSAVTPENGPDDPVETIYDAHLYDEQVRRLATHPTLVALAESMLGSKVNLWRSTFWIKSPGARRLEWHQDTYKSEGLGSFPNINAWVTIDETTEDNCVWLVSGSHQSIIDLQTFKSPDYVEKLKTSPRLPEPPVGAPRGVAKMILKSGQCFLFDGRVLHGSQPNQSPGRRAGIVIRFIPENLVLPNLKSTPIPLG